jgi:hypothetical protein
MNEDVTCIRTYAIGACMTGIPAVIASLLVDAADTYLLLGLLVPGVILGGGLAVYFSMSERVNAAVASLVAHAVPHCVLHSLLLMKILTAFFVLSLGFVAVITLIGNMYAILACARLVFSIARMPSEPQDSTDDY